MSFNLSKTNIINTLLSLIPISFIAGNLIINLNILIIIIISLIFYGKKIFEIELLLLDKLIIGFFLYLVILAIYKNIYIEFHLNSDDDFTVAIKTILYCRYLLLYLIIRFLIEKQIISFKIFFITCGVITLLLCIDLIYQYFFGYDIFGFKSSPRRMSGPFGDELIAGSYLQRFSIFSFFIFPIFYKIRNEKIYIVFSSLFFSFLFFSLMIAGNRVPLLFFTIILLLIFFLEKSLRKIFFVYIILAFSIFTFSYNINEEFDDHYQVFQEEIFKIAKSVFGNADYFKVNYSKDEKRLEKAKRKYTVTIGEKKIPLANSYAKELYSGYATWQTQKYLGGGVKSFKRSCAKSKVYNCGPHPHNYYLEIMASIGLFGLFYLLIIFGIIFYSTFVKRYFFKSNVKNQMIISPFIFLFFTEIFPIRTTGSFFTTGNSTYFFLLLSILIALYYSKKSIES